jgi:hypothetical protein
MRFVHLRVPEPVLDRLATTADERGLSVSGLVRSLLADALSTPQPAPPAVPREHRSPELELHLLVAVEQVIALIESFLPQGKGAAEAVLAEAAIAAQRRLAAIDGEDMP